MRFLPLDGRDSSYTHSGSIAGKKKTTSSAFTEHSSRRRTCRLIRAMDAADPATWPAHPLYAALSSTLLTTGRAARQNSESSASIQVWAPRVGVEPTTNSLTASCSTIELPRNDLASLYPSSSRAAFQIVFALTSKRQINEVFFVYHNPRQVSFCICMFS